MHPHDAQTSTVASLCTRIALSVSIILANLLLYTGNAAVATPLPPLVSAGASPLIQAASDAIGYGSTMLPSVFGGVWIAEKANQGYVLLKGNTPANRSQIANNVRHPELLSFSASQFSETELWSIRDRIWADRASLRASGLDIVAIGEATDLNKVMVDIVTDAAGASAATTRLTQLYSTTAIVAKNMSSRPQTTNRDGPLPWSGGYTLDGNVTTCTLGFIGYRQPNWELLTAGHCFGVGATVSHPNIGLVGPVDQNMYSNGSRADAETIQFSSGAGHTVLARTPPDVFLDVNYTQVQQIIGKIVCKSGRATNETCFTVSVVHTAYNSFDQGTGITTNLVDMIQADYNQPAQVDRGDSGGPVYTYSHGPIPNTDPVGAEGIVSGQGNNGATLFYSFIGDIQTDLNFTVLTFQP